jgi:hypothetical protein
VVEILPLAEGSSEKARQLLADGYRLVGVGAGVMVFEKAIRIENIDLDRLEETIRFLVDLRNHVVAVDEESDSATMAGIEETLRSCRACKHFRRTGKENDAGDFGGYCEEHGWSTPSSGSCEKFEVIV